MSQKWELPESDPRPDGVLVLVLGVDSVLALDGDSVLALDGDSVLVLDGDSVLVLGAGWVLDADSVLANWAWERVRVM